MRSRTASGRACPASWSSQRIAHTDWQRSTTRFGNTRTVEWCFRQPVLHFEEHARDVAHVAGVQSKPKP